MLYEGVEHVVCAECRFRFVFEAERFASRGLQPPRLCLKCREARASRLEPRLGLVISSGPTYAIVKDRETAERFIVYESPERWAPGTTISFDVDPEEPMPAEVRRRRLARNPRPEAWKRVRGEP